MEMRMEKSEMSRHGGMGIRNHLNIHKYPFVERMERGKMAISFIRKCENKYYK